ncbi:MAG: DUF4160 domain-containing protein [Ignavibacteriae bacterium]|nr:DUF4160 domain-containing protein [Ignavibacteriota bacterium]
MPTILITGPYRFYFYSCDRDEPPHVHVQRENFTAKFWIEPTILQRNNGFARTEISRIRTIVEEQKEHFLKAWNEYFSN